MYYMGRGLHTGEKEPYPHHTCIHSTLTLHYKKDCLHKNNLCWFICKKLNIIIGFFIWELTITLPVLLEARMARQFHIKDMQSLCMSRVNFFLTCLLLHAFMCLSILHLLATFSV